MTGPQPDFDRIARPYRWLEYLTLGRTLERCRLHFLPHLASRTHALVLGDGDGRFLAQLLRQNSLLQADAVDSSATMLSLLGERCHRASPSAAARLKTHHSDALTFLATPSLSPYDLVVTHFFLDCLTEPELTQLVSAASTRLTPGALWLVSDFRIPDGPMRLPATLSSTPSTPRSVSLQDFASTACLTITPPSSPPTSLFATATSPCLAFLQRKFGRGNPGDELYT